MRFIQLIFKGLAANHCGAGKCFNVDCAGKIVLSAAQVQLFSMNGRRKAAKRSPAAGEYRLVGLPPHRI
jgi:hypothetical protein